MLSGASNSNSDQRGPRVRAASVFIIRNVEASDPTLGLAAQLFYQVPRFFPSS